MSDKKHPFLQRTTGDSVDIGRTPSYEHSSRQGARLGLVAEHGDPFPYRWWITAPGEDETLRSLVERADRVYDPPPDGTYVWQESDCHVTPTSLDAPTARELRRLARMLGVRATKLHAHRLEDHPRLLQPAERRAYCRECVRADRAAGQPRTFRRAWARVFVLSCPKHGTPLQWAEPRLAAITDHELVGTLEPPSADVIDILRLIDTFACTLEDCLWRGDPWPTIWRGNPYAARALLIRCLCNLTAVAAVPATAFLSIMPALERFIGCPKGPIAPLRGACWETFRGVGRPAWRRASIWMTAWQVIPDLPSRLRPTTIPEAYFADENQWWKELPPSAHTDRLRRQHCLLQRQCVSFHIDEAGIPPP